jgi:hypothetical protein
MGETMSKTLRSYLHFIFVAFILACVLIWLLIVKPAKEADQRHEIEMLERCVEAQCSDCCSSEDE